MGRPRKSERLQPIQPTILAAATQLFAKNGYHGTSLAAVAAAADIKAPSILYHFGSKDGLYAAVVRGFYEQLSASMGGMDGGNPLASFHALRDLNQTDRKLLVTIIAELMSAGRAADIIEAAIVPLLEQISQALGDGPLVRQKVMLLIMAYVMNLDAGDSLPEVDRLRRAVWGNGALDELAVELLKPRS